MIQALLPALCALAISTTAWAQAEPTSLPAGPAQAEVAAAAPEQVLVVGKKPGPGLWKISHGDHVLWIFGTYSPLPLKLEWRSQEVEDVIARSQHYLTAPSMSAHVGFFTQLTLLPFAIGVTKNPDGKTLRDVLPAEVYGRWQVLKKRYIGNDESIERERPIFAAAELHRKGSAQAGLGSDREVREALEKLIRKNKLARISSDVKLSVDEPVKLLREFKKTTLDDAACLTRTLDRLETDIAELRLRANAWAKGDIAAIEQLDFKELEDPCLDAVLNSSMAKNQPQFQTVQAHMRAAWLANAETALKSHGSTFAMLPLKDLLGDKSMIAELRALGYSVQAPE